MKTGISCTILLIVVAVTFIVIDWNNDGAQEPVRVETTQSRTFYAQTLVAVEEGPSTCWDVPEGLKLYYPETLEVVKGGGWFIYRLKYLNQSDYTYHIKAVINPYPL